MAEFRPLLPDNAKNNSETSFSFHGGLPVASIPTDPVPGSRSEDAGFSTPLQTAAPVAQPLTVPDDTAAFTAQDSEPLLQYILLWENPALSAVSLVGTLLVLVLFATVDKWWPHGSLVTVVCKVLLIDLAFNFIRGMLSSSWQQKSLWVNSNVVVWLCNTATGFIKNLAVLHDKYLSARDPVTTLQVAVAIWVLSILSCFLSSFALVVLIVLCLFTIPYALTRAKPQLVKAKKAATAQAKEHYQRLGLNRKAEFGLIAVVMIGFLMTSHWNTIAMAIFVALVALRCKLKQTEVDAIHVAAAPYTETVTKAGKAITVVANDCVARLTPVRHRHEP